MASFFSSSSFLEADTEFLGVTLLFAYLTSNNPRISAARIRVQTHKRPYPSVLHSLSSPLVMAADIVMEEAMPSLSKDEFRTIKYSFQYSFS